MTSVLIVEDNASTVEAVIAMLEVIGYEDVRSAGDGLEGLAMIREHQPDIMFLDIMMPNMDGLEMLRELRAGSAPRPGRIVVMSAHANANDQNAVRQLGADHFIGKPFTLEQLESAIEANDA